MKVRWKKGFAVMLALFFAVGNTIPLSADFTQNSISRQYLGAEEFAYANSWIQDSGNWYHLDSAGKRQIGWFQDTDSQWYFLDYHTGAMKTGWIKPADGKWYFLDYHTGVMKKGWIQPMDGKWYYLDTVSGEMKTGWFQDIDKNWYYLDALSGAMQTGRVMIQGMIWTLQANGVWDGKSGMAADESWSLVWDDEDDFEDSDKDDDQDKDDQERTDFFVDKQTKNVIIYKEGVYSADMFGIDEINDLTISELVGNGDLTLDGLTVNGTTTIEGGGENTVHIVNCKLRIVIAAKRLTEGANPLHISFEGTTTVSEAVHATTGKVKISIQEKIVIPSIIASVASEIGGAGSVGVLRITASIKISLSVKVSQLQVNSADIKPEVNVSSNAEISDVTGIGALNIKIIGKGTVTGYHSVTLDANGGYWITEDFDDIEKRESQITVKIKVNQTIGTVLKEKEIPLPKQEGMEFNGWYKNDEMTETTYRLNLDEMICDRPITLYAGWVDSEEIVPVKSAEIDGLGYVYCTLKAKANKDATGILTYQWYQCDKLDGVYQPIEGAVLESYYLGEEMEGLIVKVEISSNHSEAGIFSEAICVERSGEEIEYKEGTIKDIKISGTPKVTYYLDAVAEWEDDGNYGFYEWYVSDQKDGVYQEISSGGFYLSAYLYITEELAGKYVKIHVKSLNEWESEPIQIDSEIPLLVKELQAQIVTTGSAVTIPSRQVSNSYGEGNVTFTVTASGSAVTVDQKTDLLVVSGSAVHLKDIQVTGKNNKGVDGTYVWKDPDSEVKEHGTYSLEFIPDGLEGEKAVVYVWIEVEFPPDYDIDIDIDIDIDLTEIKDQEEESEEIEEG